MASQLRRRLGTKKKSTAKTAPPVDGQNSFSGWLSAVAAVVLTVRVDVAGEAETFAEDGLIEQVAGALEAVGLIAQLRLTEPVNPPEGVTEIVEVPLPPRVTLMLPLLLRANDDDPDVTFTFTTVVCVIDPDVPVTVTT
jgi:hypothetical protein